jgi:hypothetical protein
MKNNNKKGNTKMLGDIKIQELFVKYIQSISSKFAHEETREMGYRTDFEI